MQTTEEKPLPDEDHREIWLEPRADEYQPEGRLWCQHDVWEDGVRYVRADVAEAEKSELARQALALDGEMQALQAERDYSVKARLMAEKDLEMALIDVGRLQAENARLRAALEEIRQQYGQPDVYSTATRIKLIADAALKGGEEGGEGSACPACSDNYCTVNEGCIAIRVE